MKYYPMYDAVAKAGAAAFKERQAKPKHEEIKRMAWEVTLRTIIFKNSKEYTCVPCKAAWKMAEDFCKFAKEKEEMKDG